MAEAWTPTFPPVPPIRGMKKARAVTAASWASKPPRISELTMPPIMPISSQGRRALVWAKMESSASMSEEIPEAS